MRRWLGIIPARAGSKRLPGKNRLFLDHIPLWRISVNQAIEAGCSHVVVTTDDPEILKLEGRDAGFSIRKRPLELCGDASPVEDAVRDVLQHHIPTLGVGGYDSFVVLNPTHPLRAVEDITDALKMTEFYPTVTGVRKDYSYTIMEGSLLKCMNEQDRVPRLAVTGAIYACRVSAFIEFGKLMLSGLINKGAPLIQKGPYIDIDTYEDYLAARGIYERREARIPGLVSED